MSVFHTENLENTENFKLKSIPCSLRKLHYTENINYMENAERLTVSTRRSQVRVMPTQPRRRKLIWLATFLCKKVANAKSLLLLFRKKSRSHLLSPCIRGLFTQIRSLPTFFEWCEFTCKDLFFCNLVS